MVFGLGIGVRKSAYAEGVDAITATLAVLCNMEGAIDTAHTTGDLINGTTISDIGTTNIKVTCNDVGGYSIQAVGFSNDEEGNTNMIGNIGDDYNIATGTATSGGTSNWAMKVTPVQGVYSTGDFSNYSAVPANYTKVLQKDSGVEPGSTVQATTTYQVFASSTQPAGTYIGKVKYVLVHPSIESCPDGYEPDGSGGCKKAVCVGYQKMQDIASIKDSLQLEVQTQLCDTRDEKIYWVAKLKDGNVWMTQNLDLDLGAPNLATGGENGTLTPNDTNVTSNWTPERSTIATSSDTVSGWTNDNNNPYSVNRGSYYQASGLSSTLSSITCTAANNGGENCHYHIGNHYNWSAAVASNDTSGKTSGTASDSICPKGWRLPTGDSSGEYKALITTAYSIASSSAGETTLRSAPLFFVRSGIVYGGSLYDVGSYGGYWSSTVVNSNSAYELYFGSSYVSPTTGSGNRIFGGSVRCIAE